MYRTVLLSATVWLAMVSGARAQQVPDLSYNPPIPRPAYELGKGPSVAIDEAHHNFHTSENRYSPFAKLLRRDGYRVSGFSKPFSADSLKNIDVLVIANALHERNATDWSLPTPSAFTENEIAAVRTWVEQGGSLFLIADHMPFPGAANDLAKAFGANFSNGYARPGHQQPGIGDTFEEATGLKKSAVTRGRSDDEKVTKVTTFTGSAFQPPEDATPVMVFGAGSVSLETTQGGRLPPDTPRVDIEGWCHGALLNVGKGRLALFGEAASFTAQLSGPNQQRKMGMNHPNADQNYQLLLNVLHWLTRVEGMPD